MPSRDWCYHLEQVAGLEKGNFDIAQKLLNDCRDSGLLPIDICATDDNRALEGVEALDYQDAMREADWMVDDLIESHINGYLPQSAWASQDYYVVMAVEKKGLRNLFAMVCQEYSVPLLNFKGWSDKHSRADLLKRFGKWQREGKKPVLLYCGDHDPGGLIISDRLHKNFKDVENAVWKDGSKVDFNPDDLIIDRFGLNYDFIVEHNISRIDNLITGKGLNLGYPKSASEKAEAAKPYVVNYVEQFGRWKVEANAMAAIPEIARQLCRDSILKYVDQGVLDAHNEMLVGAREELRSAVAEKLAA